MRLGTNMTPWGLVSVLTLAGSAVADLNFTNWQPPQPSDFRSPCPAMNSLANHNFIQHDGRNITIESLVPVLQQVFHLSEELATIVSRLGLFTAKDPSQGVFTLEDLNTHNLFEHDASLSRADFYDGGDAHTFRQDIFDKFISHFDGMEFVTLEAAALARYSMVLESRKNNPTFTYGVQQQITSYGETIKYFRTIVDPETEKCPVAWVKILFQEQRLPYNEGWRPPKTEISGFSMASDVLQLALVTPEKNN